MMSELMMKSVFRDVLLPIFVVQLYLIVLAVSVMAPLYFTVYPDRSGRAYLLTAVIVLIFKGWNLLANWWMLKIRDTRIRYTDQTIRSLLNMIVFYFLV